MQGDHLNRETLQLCDITLLSTCALQHAGKSGHAYESSWDTEHLGKGETVLIGKGKAQWSPRWEGQAAEKRDCASAQSLTCRLSSSCMSEHVDSLPAKYMNLSSVRICVAVLREARAGALRAMSPGSCTEQAYQTWGHTQILSRIPSRVQTCITDP